MSNFVTTSADISLGSYLLLTVKVKCHRRRAEWCGQREPDWLTVHASAPFKFLGVQNGEPTPAQRDATRFGTVCAVQCVASPVLRNAPVCLPTGKMSQPMQWSQVVDHTGHPDRAAARMRGHLGNLGSASAPMVEPGENQSSYSLEQS